MKPSPYLVNVLEQAVTDSMNLIAHLERQVAAEPDRPELHQQREEASATLRLKRLQLCEARLGILVWPMQEAVS